MQSTLVSSVMLSKRPIIIPLTEFVKECRLITNIDEVDNKINSQMKLNFCHKIFFIPISLQIRVCGKDSFYSLYFSGFQSSPNATTYLFTCVLAICMYNIYMYILKDLPNCLPILG